MTSPLSVGDCIAIIGVIIKGYGALSGTSDDAKELSRLVDDLLHMQEILEQFAPLDSVRTSDSNASIKKLDDAVSRCQAALSELADVAKKYEPTESRVMNYYRRITWTFSGKTKMEPLQKRIQSLTINLSVIQDDINRRAIEDLKAEVQRQTNGLSSQMEQGKQEVKTCIYAAIDEPWDRKPIRFQDATGRRFPVPLEICQHFEDFCDFLKFSFKKLDQLLPFVTRKDFWLFTPAVNGSSWWYLIHENDWVDVARPGVQLGMSLFQADYIDWLPGGVYSCGFEEYTRESAERKKWPLVRGPQEDSYIRFSKPVPSWSTLPESLEFRWWYVVGLGRPSLGQFRWLSQQKTSDV
ncbi:hypothetical protein FALCPG4_015890 [Fusarium falciforme]